MPTLQMLGFTLSLSQSVFREMRDPSELLVRSGGSNQTFATQFCAALLVSGGNVFLSGIIFVHAYVCKRRLFLHKAQATDLVSKMQINTK